ncbi:MAG: hypothetical protein AMXMBFR64_33550 [Myxococcales bacterium]
MLTLTAEWNQPVRGVAGATTHYLAVRVGAPATPVSLAAVVLLDVSGSMDERLDPAKDAVRTVWRALRPGDRLTVLTFASRVTSLVDGAEKGRTADSDVLAAIDTCAAGGVTLLGEALQAGVRALDALAVDGPRFLWVVTDGHPTGPDGRVLEDPTPVLSASRRAATQGAVIGTLGLGDARHWQASFLAALADAGRGSFCYAPEPAGLAAELEERVRSAQEVSAVAARLDLRAVAGVRLLSAVRVLPELLPLEAVDRLGSWSIPLGAVEPPVSAYVLEVAVAVPFGAAPGPYAVGSIGASATVRGDVITAQEAPLCLELAAGGDRRVHGRHRDAENLRIARDIGYHGWLRANESSPGAQARLTGLMADAARRSGNLDLAARFEEDLAAFQQAGALDTGRAAESLVAARRSGRLLMAE